MTRRAAATVVGVLAASVAWAAYVYSPPEVRDRPSRYLASTPTAYVDTAVARFHYQHQGSGPPVVLVHGGGEWLYSFRETIIALAAQGYSVFALDLPGHGYTEVHNRDFGYDLPAMTSALASFMDAVGVARAAMVGHSWGGGIALGFAQRYPDRVTRLALIDSSGLDVPDVLEWRLLGVPVIGEIMSKLVRRSDVKAGLTKAFHHTSLVHDAMVEEVWVPLTFRENRRAQYLLARNLDWSVTEAALAQTATPTLVVWGADDKYLGPDNAHRLVELLPHATAVIIDRCGHSAHEDCPLPVVTQLSAFLATTR